MEDRFKQKVIIPVALFIGLLVSLGVNVWLYGQLTLINQGVKNIQTQQASIQSDYDDLAFKIGDGKRQLTDLQAENSKLERGEQ